MTYLKYTLTKCIWANSDNMRFAKMYKMYKPNRIGTVRVYAEHTCCMYGQDEYKLTTRK